MTKATRIYAVTIRATAASPRLVRASSMAQAFHFVADEMVTAEIASQDALYAAATAGTKIEEITVQ